MKLLINQYYWCGNIMLEPLFESKIKENILLYLFINNMSYPSELSRNFNLNLFAVQNQLKKLESGGILYRQLKGNVRLYDINPRYPFKKELEALLDRVYDFLNDEVKEKYFIKRTRPRKGGKPL
jgi:predicted transcriptional regulator